MKTLFTIGGYDDTPTSARDQAHLMHPLHHPSAYAATRDLGLGAGAIITDPTGREYIDGLAGLWNVNVGHGRRELAEAAQPADDDAGLPLVLRGRDEPAGDRAGRTS